MESKVVTNHLSHINTEDVLIKVWGITDHSRYAITESILDVWANKIESPSAACSILQPGKLVLALYENKYRRAEIIRVENTSSSPKVIIRLIDIGALVTVNSSFIRSIDVVKHLNTLDNKGLAEEFILHGVVKKKSWTSDELTWANDVLKMATECTFVSVVSDKILVDVTVPDASQQLIQLSSLLIKHGFAEVVEVNQLRSIIHNMYAKKVQAAQYQYSSPALNNVSSYPQLSLPQVHQNIRLPVAAYPARTISHTPSAPPGILQFPRLRYLRPAFNKPLVQQNYPHHFGIDTLPVGSTHEVYVSHVIDGMQSFTVQLKKNVDEKLPMLMASINEHKAQPFTGPLLPGSICLGRYPEDKSLCRAVVSSVLADGANLYYVDFGNSDIVPFSEIYKILPEFMLENVMALRFTLSKLGSNYSLSTQEAQSIFQKLVDETSEVLLMKVAEPEMHLKQYCDLFLLENSKHINIKNKIFDKVKVMRPASYQKIPLQKNNVDKVFVSFVESPLKFFVQLEHNQSLLDILMKSVEHYCTTSEMKELLYAEDVNENMAVCAQYSDDNKWYRGIIVDEVDSNGNVEVFYVDYGNQESVHFSKLCIMNNEMISKFPKQAIECRLEVDSEWAINEKVISNFVEIADSNSFTMTVKNICPSNVLLVTLVDSEGVNVLDLLKNAVSKVIEPPTPIFSYSRPTPLQVRACWRERPPSNAEGDYYAFRKEDNHHSAKTDPDKNYSKTNNFDYENKKNLGTRTKNYNGTDETDRAYPKKDSWNRDTKEKQNDQYSRNDSSDSWRGVASRDKFSRTFDHNENEQQSDRTNTKFGGRSKENSWYHHDDRAEVGEGKDGATDWRSSQNSGWGGNQENRNHTKVEDSSTWKSKRSDGDDWKSKRSDGDSWPSRSDRNDRNQRDNWGDKENNRNRFSDDSHQNKWDDKNQRSDGWGKSSYNTGAPAVTLLDGFEKGAEFLFPDYQINQQINVAVSWFVNPIQFFVIPANQDEFRKVMEEIQEEYPKRKPLEANDLAVNDCVVARAKDKILYRAMILRTRPGGAVVTFVDYGNVESITKDGLYAINPDHCKIPAQAFCCSLHNILSASENGQWKQSSDLDKYFGKDEYQLTFIDCEEDKNSITWFVDLVDLEGTNIIESLLTDGIALKKFVIESEEVYELNFFKHQILTVYPGHIESSKKFFVHIEPPKVDLIREKIDNLKDSQGFIPLPAENIMEGEFCLACADDQDYYRALILTIDQSTQMAHILFIDYGDVNDVATNSIMSLPEDLAVFNPQAVECSLCEAESFTDDDAFIESLSEKDFIIKVEDVIDDKLLVYVFDINGNRLPFPIEVKETVSKLCSLPMLKYKEKVTVTHITQDRVYVQRTCDFLYLTNLSNQLSSKYEATEIEKVPLEPDNFYAAKSGLFDGWYRCKLMDSDPQEVYYIDYGNKESVEELISVKTPLDSQFFEYSALCIPVLTSVTFTADDLTPLIEAVQDLIFDAVFERTDSNEWFANLTCTANGKTLVDYAVENNCGIKKDDDNPKEIYEAFKDWHLNEDKSVKVSCAHSPSKFYLQLCEDVDKITTMHNNLQSALKKIIPMVENFEGLCACKSLTDNTWFRSLVSSKDNTAFAVDFGYDVDPTRIKKLPKNFALDDSKYIVQCRLNIDPIENDWDEAMKTRFTDLTSNAEICIAKLEYVTDNSKIIDLSIDKTSLSEMFVRNNLAQWKGHEVTISHTVSLEEFYIQDIERERKLNEISTKLLEAENWDTIEPNVGDIVAAQFKEDQLWYRAVLLKVENGSKYVKFIDYGNEDESDQFRVLPECLKTVSNLAVRCVFQPLPENVDKYTEEFVSFVSDCEGTFTVYFLSRVEPVPVMMYWQGSSIDDLLKKKLHAAETEEGVTQNETDEGLSLNTVTVCHINSPSSFYVKSENARVFLDKIENGLIDIESSESLTEPAVNMFVAAKFSEDELWYRAKITDISSDDGITAIFVDYGNVSVVSELRHLSEEISVIPHLAKHCAFSLPNNFQEWPEISTDRFAELTCEDTTIFRMVLKEDGDPAYVDLYDDGCNVLDEITTLCISDLATPLQEMNKTVVKLSHVESIKRFWIQFQTPQLDEMINEMVLAETFDSIDTATEGTLVAALCDESSMWHRGKVINNVENGYKVLLIDTGKEIEVTVIRSLPVDLVNLPPLATCCLLKNVSENTEIIPDAILSKLKEFAENETKFTLGEIFENDESGISVISLLYDNGEDLADEFIRTFNENKEELFEPCVSESAMIVYEKNSEIEETVSAVNENLIEERIGQSHDHYDKLTEDVENAENNVKVSDLTFESPEKSNDNEIKVNEDFIETSQSHAHYDKSTEDVENAENNEKVPDLTFESPEKSNDNEIKVNEDFIETSQSHAHYDKSIEDVENNEKVPDLTFESPEKFNDNEIKVNEDFIETSQSHAHYDKSTEDVAFIENSENDKKVPHLTFESPEKSNDNEIKVNEDFIETSQSHAHYDKSIEDVENNGKVPDLTFESPKKFNDNEIKVNEDFIETSQSHAHYDKSTEDVAFIENSENDKKVPHLTFEVPEKSDEVGAVRETYNEIKVNEDSIEKIFENAQSHTYYDAPTEELSFVENSESNEKVPDLKLDKLIDEVNVVIEKFNEIKVNDNLIEGKLKTGQSHNYYDTPTEDVFFAENGEKISDLTLESPEKSNEVSAITETYNEIKVDEDLIETKIKTGQSRDHCDESTGEIKSEESPELYENLNASEDTLKNSEIQVKGPCSVAGISEFNEDSITLEVDTVNSESSTKDISYSITESLKNNKIDESVKISGYLVNDNSKNEFETSKSNMSSSVKNEENNQNKESDNLNNAVNQTTMLQEVNEIDLGSTGAPKIIIANDNNCKKDDKNEDENILKIANISNSAFQYDNHYINEKERVDSDDLVTVTYINDPGNFFVRKIGNLSRALEIEDKLRTLISTADKLIEVTVGMVVAMKIEKSCMRAKIINVDNFSGYIASCIDYGNKCSAPTVFALPDELKNIEPLALHCALPLPAHLDDWPQSICEEFVEMAQSENPKFKLEILQTVDDITHINLINEEINILARINDLCSKCNSELETNFDTNNEDSVIKGDNDFSGAVHGRED